MTELSRSLESFVAGAPTRRARREVSITFVYSPSLYFGELGRPQNVRSEGDFKIARNWRYKRRGNERRSHRVRVGRQIRSFALSTPMYTRRWSASRLLAASATVCVWLLWCRAVLSSRRASASAPAVRVKGERRRGRELSSFVGLFFFRCPADLLIAGKKSASLSRGIRVSLFSWE